MFVPPFNHLTKQVTMEKRTISDLAKTEGAMEFTMLKTNGYTVFKKFFMVSKSPRGKDYLRFTLMSPSGLKVYDGSYGPKHKDVFINDRYDNFTFQMEYIDYIVFYDPIVCYTNALERARALMRKMNQAKVKTMSLCGRSTNEGRLLKQEYKHEPYKTFKDVLEEMKDGKTVKLAYKRSGGKITESFFHIKEGSVDIIEKCNELGKPLHDAYYFDPLSFDCWEYDCNQTASRRDLSIVLFADRRMPYEEKLKSKDIQRVHDKILDYQGELSLLIEQRKQQGI